MSKEEGKDVVSKDTYREKLFSYLKQYIVDSLAKQTFTYEGKKILELKGLNIRNHYGLEIAECILVHDPSIATRYQYLFKCSYKIADLLPFSPGIKTYCFIEGNILDDTLSKFIQHIASKVYCRDCGNLRNDSEYFKEEDQCAMCTFETLILYEKNPSIFCTVCQTETRRFTTLKCGHTFHRKCVSKLLRNACPLCVRPITDV